MNPGLTDSPGAQAGFSSPVSRLVWETRYRRHAEPSVSATWRRVATALASVEPRHREAWEGRFFAALDGFRFLPGGRILAGAGSGRDVTLFNCFVMGSVADSLDGIFDALKEGALTMQQGGGVGYDFSTLRPAGSAARRSGTLASGPVSFMGVWDGMCETLLSTAARRGAMMATLRCDHPDIERFIDAKSVPGALRNFNLSVLLSDAFMQAVDAGAEWPLVFPEVALAGEFGDADRVSRRWSGAPAPVSCAVLRRVPARELWQRLMRAAYDGAEPGVLFVDRIDRLNNLAYRERISATNPCGELPLPAYGACNLGSLNLSRFVCEPFTPSARLDWEALERATAVAVRMLDNVIDLSSFPLPAQAREARGARRVGLGMTALADSLIMLGLHYADARAREVAAEAMRRICHAAYRASVALAREKGAFPYLDRGAYLEGVFIRTLPADIRDGIARDGIRNSHLTAIAPTGTVSLLADNVSSGIEPVFQAEYARQVRGADGVCSRQALCDYAVARWRSQPRDADLPGAFVTARELPPADHLAMQAALQPFVDSAISKTVNVPADYPYEAFRSLYLDAYRAGLKGCTTYRPNPLRGTILDLGEGGEPESLCCSLDRETGG